MSYTAHELCDNCKEPKPCRNINVCEECDPVNYKELIAEMRRLAESMLRYCEIIGRQNEN